MLIKVLYRLSNSVNLSPMDTEVADSPPAPGLLIRRDLRPGDLGAIVAMHGRLYLPVYGLSAEFEAHVAASVGRAGVAGFPGPRESIQLLEDDRGGLLGSCALTDDGEGLATLRWVLLDRGARGLGIGRGMIIEAVAGARAAGFDRVGLETFSDLTAAAAIYRSLGFRLVSEDREPRWGRTEFAYQRYELGLASG